MAIQRQAQRGAVTIMTAGFLLLAVVSLALVVDSGRLYLEKRKLQRVADLAAIEAVARSGTCPTTAQSYAVEAAARNGFTVSGVQTTLVADCGGIATGGGIRQLDLSTNDGRTIRVKVSREVPASLIAGGIFGYQVKLTATAAATKGVPLAALTLRSTLTTFDTANSPLLNPLIGGLLGGNVGVGVMSWNGLATTDINLFRFLDALKVQLNLTVGGYDQVLASNVTVGQIIGSAISVLPAGGDSATVKTALEAIQLAANANLGPLTVKVGELLGFQTGTPVAGADLKANVFDLIFATAQLANHENTLAAAVPITLPIGLGTVTLKIKVIEPPRISAIGNPALAKANPTGPNKIYVRTAQTRLLLSTSIPGLSSITSIVNSVTNLLSPVTSLLQSVFSSLFGCLVSCTETETRPQLFPGNPVRLDIGLDLGGAEAKVVDYDCNAGSKSLTANGTTYAAKLQIGQIDAANFFSSTTIPAVGPIPILDVEKRSRTKTLLGLLWGDWSAWTLWTRTGLVADSSVAETQAINPYSNPPEINSPPGYYAFASTNLVSSLSNTLSGLQLKTYQYDSAQLNGFGALVGLVDLTVSSTVTLVKAVVNAMLAPLLDPLINGLLKALGINLAQTDVGHNLSCGSLSGVSLIY